MEIEFPVVAYKAAEKTWNYMSVIIMLNSNISTQASMKDMKEGGCQYWITGWKPRSNKLSISFLADLYPLFQQCTVVAPKSSSHSMVLWRKFDHAAWCSLVHNFKIDRKRFDMNKPKENLIWGSLVHTLKVNKYRFDINKTHLKKDSKEDN